MLDALLGLDPTVQVAIVGGVVTLVAGVFAWLRVHFTPKTDAEEIVYGPKPVVVVFTEDDRRRLDDLTAEIEDLSEAIERLRQDMRPRR